MMVDLRGGSDPPLGMMVVVTSTSLLFNSNKVTTNLYSDGGAGALVLHIAKISQRDHYLQKEI